MTKKGYADSLKELEKISEEIHDRRVLRLGERGEGVGAENPSSPSSAEDSTVQTPSYEKLDDIAEAMEHLKVPEKDDSDSESLTSMEVLDDNAIDQLMRTATEELPKDDD